MPSRPLELSAWDPAWADRFEAEAKRVRKALGKRLLQLEHVGGTAVPGAVADPVMDLAVGVATEADAATAAEALRKLGYDDRGRNDGDPRRRDFVLEREGRRVARLHLWTLPAEGWDQHVAFRDRLRGDAALVAAYNALKVGMLVERPGDHAAYAARKRPFIEAVLAGQAPPR